MHAQGGFGAMVRRLFACAALIGLASAALAQDLGSILGPLADTVGLGQSGAWTAAAEAGRFVLDDPNDAGAVRFYRIPWQGDAAHGRSVGVRVTATGAGAGGAGLVYRVQDRDPRWLALLLTPRGTITLVARAAAGLQVIKEIAVPGGAHAEGELLQISEQGGGATLLANGAIVAHLDAPAGGTADLPVGVVAIGPGRFGYREFAFGPAVVASQAGDDRIPAAGGDDDRVPPPTGTAGDANAIDPLTVNVIGATIGILAHEFGHFMIGELKIPATGPEEDVADEFSAMVFVDNIKDDPKLAIPMGLAGAKLWWYMSEEHAQQQTPWYDEHAPDKMRFAKFMCMLYGANPQVFEPVMQETGIPERTRQRCIQDEVKRHTAWTALLQPHRRRGVDPIEPGDLDPATPGHRVTVEYQPPQNETNRKLAEYLRQTKIFDVIAEQITKLYVLPRDTRIVLRDCGVENCFYNPDDGSVTMCYEMLGFVLQTFLRHEGQGGDAAPAPQAGPAPQSPAPGGGGGTMTLAQLLTGTWRIQTSTQAGIEEVVTRLNPDGTYQTRDTVRGQQGAFTVTILGQWSVQPAGGNQIQLALQPMQWAPRQFCSQPGYCQPVPVMPSNETAEIIDRNTLLSRNGRIVRVQ